MGNVIEIQSGQVDPNELAYSQMYHIGGANIESHSGNLIDLKIAKEENLISGKYLFTKDHILYSKIRPYLNKVVSPKFTGICSADIYPIKPKEELLEKHYLRFILMSSDFLRYTSKHSDRTNIPKLNRKALNGYRISLPPLALQQKFTALVDRVEKLCEKQRQSAQELENLFQSLMHRYFG